MSRITLQTIETAPEGSKTFLEKAKAKNGFIPNLLAVLGNAPVAIETYLTVSEINSRSSFTLAERETIQITAAALQGCGFCVAGHTAISYKQGKLDKTLLEALREERTLPDAKLDALRRLTQSIILHRGAVPAEDLRDFLSHGYNEQQVIETILGVSLATLCNFSNSLAETELNPELSAYLWEPNTKN